MISPPGVIRAILLPSYSVNQTFPSGPAVTAHGRLLGVGTANSTIVGVREDGSGLSPR